MTLREAYRVHSFAFSWSITSSELVHLSWVLTGKWRRQERTVFTVYNKYSTDNWHQRDLIVTNPSIRFTRMTWLVPVSKISSSDKHQEIKLWALSSVQQYNLCLFGAYSYSQSILALLPSELMEGNIKFRLPVVNISSHAKVCGWYS